MNFADLVQHCVTCFKTFNPIYSTIDSHADTYLQEIKDPYEKVFIKQVFYGCIRYQDFLKVFTKILIEKNPVGTSRSDIPVYIIFGYISFFRLEELAIEDFRKLVLSQDATRMHTFLQFAFNAESLRQNVRDQWMELYDFQYINDKIIGGIEKNLPNVAEVLRTVEKKAVGRITSQLTLTASSQNDAQSVTSSHQGSVGGVRSASAKGGARVTTPLYDDNQVKKTTRQIPFNLTKPKPKVILQPLALERETKANPIPRGLFKKTLEDIEKEKEERRKAKTDAIRRQYEENPKKRFELATSSLPTIQKFDKTKQELENKLQSELKFQGVKPRKVPDFEKIEAPVKLTAAAVKREALALKIAEDKEIKRIKDLEYNQRDETEFVTWKREMDERDEVIRLDYIQRKKLEMELAREEAILAQEKQAQDNKENAIKMKIEATKRLEEREKNFKEEFDKKIEIVEQVHSQKDKAEEACKALREENRELRNKINKELTDALQRKKDEEEVEHRKRQELIRQIRELERIPIVRTKGFDPTEAGDHGLLEEMSIAELRERLEFQRRQNEQDLEMKRQQNLARKDKESEDLISTSQKIQEAREKRKQENELRKKETQEKKERMEQMKKEIREKGICDAYDKISKKKQEKKEQDEKLAKELKEISLQRQYMNANAAMVEEKAWRELEQGAQRKVENYQNEKLLDQAKMNAIIVKDQMVRATNNKNQVINKLIHEKQMGW